MKILLVKPYNRSDHIQPSLGLGYLATAVRQKHEVDILDCIKENMNIERFSHFIRKYNPDVIGLQCYTFDVHFILDAVRAAKEVRKDIVTVIGGPHPSALPEDMLEKSGGDIDFLFTGEAEIGFPQLVDSINNGRKDYSRIPGLAWREGVTVKKNDKLLIDNLDSLGMPAWDLIHPETYPESQHGAFFKKFPIAPIMLTRGCPFPCTFCAGGVVSGKKIRTRSVDSVLNEITLLYKEFGIREFHIIDDNFSMDKVYAKNFLRRLKELNLDISWSVPNGIRMETLDEEMLKLMKETGLYLISFGIESGSDRILSLMKKGITTKRIRECVKMVQGCGIDIAGFFILGFPGDTVESMEDTIRFSTELGLMRAIFFTYLPFPGTESYEWLKARGELKNIDWERFYFTNASYVPRGLTRKKLKALQRSAFARFYLRPHIIFYHIRSIKSFRHFLFLAKRFFNWVAAS